jgi:hypothetical protein
MEINDVTAAAMDGGPPANFDDAYVRVAYAIETGDPRYAWVNDALFIGEGRLQPGPAIEYDVYQVL